jgi:hypothetical protein
LLIVDERDRLKDASGLAALTKTASSERLKLLLVGIAQNLSDLIDDHQSVERMLAQFRSRSCRKRQISWPWRRPYCQSRIEEHSRLESPQNVVSPDA